MKASIRQLPISSPTRRKSDGAVYTPPRFARYIVRQTLDPLLAGRTVSRFDQFRVLDPACGEGALLIEAYRYLLSRYRTEYLADPAEREVYRRAGRLKSSPDGLWRLTASERIRILQKHIYGLELDAAAVQTTINLLTQAALETGHQTAQQQLRFVLAENIKHGDALIGPDFQSDDNSSEETTPAFDWQAEFGGTFDAIVGNPPYVNIRLLSKHQGSRVKRYLSSSYSCAHKAYDLYVLFLERAQSLLTPGGSCGMIVPNKLATLEYAQPCRQWISQETTLLRIDDLSGLDVFPGTGVYPYIVVWRNSPPPRQHRITVLHARDHVDLDTRRRTRSLLQSGLSADGWNLHGVLDVEARVRTQPLSTRAVLHSGATGFTAQRLAESLVERDDFDGDGYEFIVSGNIDRYTIHHGGVRFMKRRFRRPLLPSDDPHTSDSKRNLYSGNKIVVAGMTRRLEAAWNPGGLALGVQVFAASEMQDHPYYLLGLLNSRLMSHLFRLRFAAKRLAGGYLAINKGQLAKLPIRVIDFENVADKQRHDEIVALVERSIEQPVSCDRRIDELVYELYELSNQEIEQIDSEDWR